MLLPDRSRYSWVFLVLMAAWPPAAWALEQAKTIDVLGWPWAQIMLSGAICLWGAMARTNQRERVAEAKWSRMETLLEFWRDARRSSVLGAVVYFMAVSQQWNEFQLGGALLLAGYAGPAALDLWADKFKAKE